MYETLQIIAHKTGLKYSWLREQALAGKLPAIRTSETGKWLAQVEDVLAFADSLKTGKLA